MKNNEKKKNNNNQCLETGLNFIKLIPATLISRKEESGNAKVFLQISVFPSDRDILRFL